MSGSEFISSLFGYLRHILSPDAQQSIKGGDFLLINGQWVATVYYLQDDLVESITVHQQTVEEWESWAADQTYELDY